MAFSHFKLSNFALLAHQDSNVICQEHHSNLGRETLKNTEESNPLPPMVYQKSLESIILPKIPFSHSNIMHRVVIYANREHGIHIQAVNGDHFRTHLLLSANSILIVATCAAPLEASSVDDSGAPRVSNICAMLPILGGALSASIIKRI